MAKQALRDFQNRLAERLQAAAATQRALEVGSHEFQANSGLQRRNVTTEQRRYNEWELGISRATANRRWQ